MDARGQLSNPCRAFKTLAEQGSAGGKGPKRDRSSSRQAGSKAAVRRPDEGRGQHSNPQVDARIGQPTRQRQRQRRLSPADAAELVTAYEAGSTIRELASQFGVHRTTVLAHVERSGVPRHSTKGLWDQTTLAAAIQLYEQGQSLESIGDRLGVHADTVAARLRRAGRELRARPGWE